jgi:non-specific serine/threonine protein kinase
VPREPLSARFGELLRDQRRAAGLTQEELAERAGVSPRSISELERGGGHIPRRDTVGLLARALGLEGQERETFEALVEERRRARPTLADAARDTPARPKHNLPRSLTSFVGRERELRDLDQLLAEAPLLTLVGAGGVGKTRLAHELVHAHAASYRDGSWLVELASLVDPALLPGAVASAVGLRDFQARNTIDLLTEYLRPKQMLLVLDNCEHLVQPCAELVARLLRACPGVRVLATSREPLALAGERIWSVPPLELPDLGQPISARQLAGLAAARLFIDRARAVNNTFVVTDENAPAIARICVGVDGIPLALELAAARTRVLTLDQLAERLVRDAGVLSQASREALPQHRTMRATIDWSHDLLGQAEQVLLRRLAVFAGGWTLELAEQVCSGVHLEEGDVLGVLGQLVDKSMALVDTREAVARYRLLEPVRQYALERLEAAGEADTYRARHAAAFFELVRQGEGEDAGPREVSSLDRLELEHPNIRVALRWALVNQDTAAALRTTAALFRVWERRGHFQEGCAWLEQALALPGAAAAPARERSRALNALAFLYWRGGDADRALPIAEEALAINREIGHTLGTAMALGGLGAIAYFRDDSARAVALLEESAAFAREAGHRPLLSVVLSFLGRALLCLKGPWDAQAKAVLDEALGQAEEASSLYARGHALATLGDLAWSRGQVETGTRLWRQSLAARAELSDRRGIAGCLERLAFALVATRRFDRAAWLFGAADAQHRILGTDLRREEAAERSAHVVVTRQQLGEGFERAWSEGHSAPLDEAIRGAFDATRRLPTRVVGAPFGSPDRADSSIVELRRQSKRKVKRTLP